MTPFELPYRFFRTLMFGLIAMGITMIGLEFVAGAGPELPAAVSEADFAARPLVGTSGRRAVDEDLPATVAPAIGTPRIAPARRPIKRRPQRRNRTS
jgi:hypothetical protein